MLDEIPRASQSEIPQQRAEMRPQAMAITTSRRLNGVEAEDAGAG
jgi:hypothetical protein